MNVTIEAVEGIIFKGLNALNSDLNESSQISVCQTTPLFGLNAAIDSLSLVSLIVDIETELNSEFNLSISLTDDRAMSRAQSPFERVDTLRDYILELVSENNR
jgi:acyl carrier protein